MRTINSSPSINALAFAEPNLELSPPAKIAAVIRDFIRYSQDELLLLAGKIIEYIKKGQAILFQYDKEGVTSFRQVAPLQIRYYDNRYYLLASTIDDKTYQPTNLLQTFTLDLFVEKKVFPAIEEIDENIEEPKFIYFDYNIQSILVVFFFFLLQQRLGIFL